MTANPRRLSLASSPLGWLVISAVSSAVCAIVVSPRVWAIFACLAAISVIGLAWPWMTLCTLRLWLVFTRDRAVEGEIVRVTARVENLSFLPSYGLTLRGEVGSHEATENDAGALAARLPYCGGLREIECHWKFIPPHRGVYPLQTPRLACGFPFGLWETHKRAESAPPLIVWPQTFPVGAIPIFPADALLDGFVSRNRAGSEGELLGVRPYRRGDSPRRIHWAQSARHDRLIVCELESLARPSARIVLDLDDAIHTPGAQGSREWAIRIAASFAKGWIESGAEVSLLADGAAIPSAGGAAHIRRLLDALAKLPQHSTRTLDALLQTTRLQTTQRNLSQRGVDIVITTDLRDDATSRTKRSSDHWVVLNSEGFTQSKSACEFARRARISKGQSIFARWLTIESPDRVRFALRYGFREASHGS